MGDWIKMRSDVDFWQSDLVFKLACGLNIDRHHALGILYDLAGWFALHSKNGWIDCFGCLTMIDTLLSTPGVTEILIDCGGLEINDGKMRLTGFCTIDAKLSGIKGRVRHEVLSVGRCEACGSCSSLTVDHIVPRSRGGGNDRNNLQCLCHRCNLKKGKKSMAYLLRWLAMECGCDGVDHGI